MVLLILIAKKVASCENVSCHLHDIIIMLYLKFEGVESKNDNDKKTGKLQK